MQDLDGDRRRHALVRELFAAAASLPPAERAAFLAKARADHGALVDEVATLLDSPGDTADLRPPDPQTAAALPQVPPYRLLEVLGEGGMGTVYLAEQLAPVRRRVALKLIKLGMDSKAVVARFEQERQALALMEHPGIAKVHDCGTSASGQPFFAMELVRGERLNAWCERVRPSVEARIRLLIAVCDAVQHAHQKGVVHRDLTPRNILITDVEGTPRPKIIDFGLAKALGQRLVDATVVTTGDQIIGTPGYMAPEQADRTAADIDTRADVYSLGVILYEQIVGSRPFADRSIADLLANRSALHTREPERPSARLGRGEEATRIAAERRTTTTALRRRLRTDLDWIAHRALEPDRNHRYATVAALADDLQRFLDGEPVSAGPPSARYRIGKLARRYRGQAITAAAILVTALTGAGLATMWAVRADAALLDFDLLATAVATERTLGAAATLLPVRPERAAAMRQWLDQDAASLLAMTTKVGDKVASLAARARRSSGEEFLLQSLRRLQGDLAVLATTRDQVERRWQFATTIRDLTLHHPDGAAWDDARAALRAADDHVASRRYAGQDLPLAADDVLGLVPIGMNPRSKLWEFYDLESAWDGQVDPRTLPIPHFDDEGRIPVSAATGIVWVLLPGGEFTMGAQKNDPDGPNHDPNARPDERPMTARLAPFFIARHELTQAQWARLWAGTSELRWPSEYHAGRWPSVKASNPVEQVDWAMCDATLRLHGMLLPTEAQWEYACRAGTTTPWACAFDQLRRHANVADLSARDRGVGWACESWRDDHVVHAPVGSFAPNDFGLFDMAGNIWEWCRDEHGEQDDVPGDPRPGDGLREPRQDASKRVFRGGSFFDGAEFARCAFRGLFFAPTFRFLNVGVRPVRALTATDPHR